MENIKLQNKKILWIEDQPDDYSPMEADIVDIIGEKNLMIARTSDEGFFLMKKNSYDLILFDLMIPKNDEELRNDLIRTNAGIFLLENLRKNNSWTTSAETKVIVFTARGNPDALHQVSELLNGKGSLIQKPMPVDDVIRIVKKELEDL